ncbi:MAG: hypothetical protein OXG05_09320 [Gammaproteobacteria bacterium]|nr:hypothetical protein [Gammaproteobacteria bacterium]
MNTTASKSGYFSAVIWLRWKLWRRRWQRQGPLLRAIGVLGTVVAIPLCVVSFFLSLGLGIVILPTASPAFVAVTWAVLISFFVYVRIMGLWISLQQDDGLALDRLLHLPIPFKTVFYINFALSQISISNLLFVPALLGLAIACLIVLPPGNWVLLPAVLAIALCLGALLHQFHNWLLLSMVNKRKRMVWAYLLFLLVIGLAQAPNLYVVFSENQTVSDRTQPRTEAIVSEIVREHSVEIEDSIESFMEESETESDHWSSGWILTPSTKVSGLPWWTIALTICLFGLAFISLRRSYRSTLARYRDGRTVRQKATARNDRSSQSKRGLQIENSPIVAVFIVTIKSWVRSAYGKMVLLSPVILLMLLPILLMRYPALIEPKSLPLLLIGIVAFIGAPAGLVCNLFAFDRLGFRLYLFSGMHLKDVLLGKLFAVFALYIVIASLVLTFAITITPISVSHLLGTVFQTGLVFVGSCVLGIVWSARYPYAVSFTSMKAHGGTATALAVLAELVLMGMVIWLASMILDIEISLDQTNRGFPVFLMVSVLEFILLIGLAALMLRRLANYVADRSNHILEAVAVEN